MPQDRINETALVTGASSGIGYELAQLFARDGSNLVLVARNESVLRDLASRFTAGFGIRVHVLPMDLSAPSAPEEIVRELQRQSITIDVLVNNAGIGAYGPFVENDPMVLQEMMHLNMVSLTLLTRFLLPEMIRKRSGTIFNVASTAAFQPGPLMAAYYATKAYVLWLSEALEVELKGSGVSVTALCPGPVRTAFQDRAQMGDSRLHKSFLAVDAATVARIGYRGMRRGKTIVIPGLANRLLAQSYRLGPRRLVTRVVRLMQETRRK